MGIQSDYLQRLIEEVSRAIAAAMGLRKKGQHEEAEQLLDRAAGDALGMDFRVLLSLDLNSVVALLGSSGRVRLLAQLTRERAELEAARGREGEAQRLRARADELEAKSAVT